MAIEEREAPGPLEGLDPNARYDRYGNRIITQQTMDYLNSKVGQAGWMQTPVDRYGYTTNPDTGQYYRAYDPYSLTKGESAAAGVGPLKADPTGGKLAGLDASRGYGAKPNPTQSGVLDVNGNVVDPTTGELIREVGGPYARKGPGNAPSVGMEGGVTKQTPTVVQGSPRTRTIAERRRAMSRSGGPVRMQRNQMARSMMAGLTPVEQARQNPASRYDPYRETWYEWGSEISGTDKGGNVWSANDLGIQY